MQAGRFDDQESSDAGIRLPNGQVSSKRRRMRISGDAGRT